MDKIWHSPEEGDSKGCIRNIHEDLAALRRENFRLRLLLYNYEQIYRQPRNCDDQESRAYTAECENVVLRKLVDARQQSLNKASEIIGSLKEENNHLKVLVDEMKSKNEEAEIDWRSKYDNLCSELQACHKEIQSRDMNLLVKDAELSRQRNEFESHISELQRQLDMSESLNHQYQQEIQLFRTEADNLRCTLENLNEEQPCLLDADAAIDQIQSADIHKSCKNHFNELSNMIHILWKQIKNAGLKPEISLPSLSDICGEVDHPVCTDSDDLAVGNTDHLANDSVSILNKTTFNLDERLNSARLLILELGNEKLRLDKLIATTNSSHERELAVIKEKCSITESQLSRQAQLHQTELTRRDSEITRLNQCISDIMKRLENSLLSRDKVQSELAILKEQLERSKRDQSQLQDQLDLEARSKENSVSCSNSVFPGVTALGETIQFSPLENLSPDELLDPKLLPPCQYDGKAGNLTKVSNLISSASFTGLESSDPKCEVQNELELTVSLSEDQGKTYSIVSSIEDSKVNSEYASSKTEDAVNNNQTEIIELQKELTVVRKQLRDQIQAMSELKAEYDMLTVNTHLGSVISDYVTSVTKGVSIDSQTSSIIGSVGDDLPTVSTPPRNLGSPVFPETLESSSGQDDGSKFLNTCDLTNSNNSASSHIESVTPAIITKKHDQENGRSNKKQSSAYPKLMISELLNPITVIPEEQETHEEGEEDKEDKEKSQVGVFTPEHTSSMNVSNEPQSLSRLRNLYDIVHDLKIRLDSVRFTQHSFVEMINRSLSTAGIDASIRLSPVQDKVDNHVNFNSSEVNNEEYHGKVSSHPNGVHQSIELAVDRCSLVSADSQVKEFHDESGLNQTVAELWGGCPKSPVRRHHEGEIITRLNKKFSKPLVQKAVHKIKGLSLKPKMSCVPHIKNRDKNLIGSTTFCAGDMDSSLQESMLSKGLSCNLDVGENNGDTLMTRRVGDLVAVGEITIVELEHRDIFERLACAMAKLRDAIDECSDVSSAFWDVDIKNNLSALLTTSCADASQIYSAQDQNQSFDIKASRGPKDTSNIVNSLQTHNSSQITNASDNFDDAIVTPDYDSIDFFAHNGNEIKSNQLYGSVGHDSQKGSNQSDQYCKQLERKLCDMMREHEQLAVKLKEATEKLARVQEENHNLETEYRSLHRQLSYPSSDTGDNKCETVNTTPDTNDDNNNNHNHNQLTENKSIQFESNDTDTTEHQYHDQNHELDLIRIELANKQELIQSLEFDHAYILNKLSLLDYHDNNDGDDKENNNCHSKMIITELIDATVAEIFASRTLITDLQYQINEFEKRFNDSIPKDDYHQLEEQVNSLRLELDQVYSEVECYKSKMKLISSSFEPLLCIEKSVSLNELIDGILNKFHEQENRINSMQIDKENAFSAMKDCLASSSTSTFDVQQIPDSLTKCIELISSESSNLRDLIRDLHLDRKEAINLLKQLTSDNDNNDLHSISDYVNWFIDLFNETQNQLNDMEQLYAVTKTSLSTCLNKFKKLEEDSKSMEEKLSEYCYRLKSCQLRLEEIVKTCIIPSTTVHNNVLKSLREAETSCNELKLKNLKYEQEFQCIGKIVGEALAKSVELDNLSDDIAEICSSLTSYRNISSIADKRSKEWEVKYNNIHNELIERNAEIDRLQNTIHSRDANIKMLTETVKGNQEFTEEIEQELYRLRQEHINCPGQHELINVQTSPIVLSLDRIHDVGTEISMIDLGVDKATDNGSVSCANNLRLRKYGELRTAAFEIKEKLIQRTEKLESALEEVARLRSVIQQDKERASITLKEVEDLREQVIRKNRKIQSLEAKVARLRSSPSKANDALLSRIRSPCHPLSAKENPRNAVCSRTTATTTGLLFQSNNSAISPDIPCCDHVVKPLSDCTNLLTLSCDDSFSNNVPSLDNEQLLSPAEPSQINHCDDLTSLISNLQSLIDELMKRSVNLNGCVKCYLSENSLNLISNNIPDDAEDDAVGSSCSNSAIHPKHSTSSWIDNDASFRLSSPSSINQPLGSHSPPPHIDGACLKSHVKSLQKTQEKLREISGKMDQLCSKFMRQCDQHLTCQVNYK